MQDVFSGGAAMTPRTFILTDDLQRQRFKQWLDRQDLPAQVEVGPVRQPRSLTQNARLWALHGIAAKATGHSAEEMHEFALARHFGSREVKLGGVVRQIPLKRSSAREKKEFGEFMEATESWYAAEFGVWLGMNEVAA